MPRVVDTVAACLSDRCGIIEMCRRPDNVLRVFRALLTLLNSELSFILVRRTACPFRSTQQMGLASHPFGPRPSRAQQRPKPSASRTSDATPTVGTSLCQLVKSVSQQWTLPSRPLRPWREHRTDSEGPG